MKKNLKPNQSSSTFQFYTFHNNSNPNSSTSNPLELVESDVVWSSDFSEPVEPASPPLSNSPNNSQYAFIPATYGLSAALSDDHTPLLQRKPSLNPSLSAATAALTIRAVPTNHRSGSPSFDEMSGSGSGRFMQSAPVNIPVWPKWKEDESFGLGKFDFDDDDDDNNNGLEEKMVLPPHEIVARSQTMAFSVFEGVGRTLKGRDLRRVRNAVFQKTGIGEFFSNQEVESGSTYAHSGMARWVSYCRLMGNRSTRGKLMETSIFTVVKTKYVNKP